MSFQHFCIQIKAFTDLRWTVTHRSHHLIVYELCFPLLLFQASFFYIPLHTPLLQKDISSSNLQQCQGPHRIFCLIVKLDLIINYLLFFYLAPIKLFLLTHPHLPGGFQESSLSPLLSPGSGRVPSGAGSRREKIHGAWALPVGNLSCIRESFTCTQLLSVSLSFPFLPRSDFSFSPHILTSRPTNLVNLSNVWFGYVKQES